MTTTTQTLTLTIADHLSELFFVRMDKLSKLAKKLGVVAPSYTKTGSVPIEKRVDSKAFGVPSMTIRIAASQYTVEYSIIRVEGDRTFVGKITHDEAGTMVREVPGFTIDPKFRTRQLCDHCDVRRSRKTYAMFDTGTTQIQIGSTCVKDYMGHDASALIGWLDGIAGLSSDEELHDIDADRVPRGMFLCDWELTLGSLIQEVSQNGFKSRRHVEAKALTNPGLTTTAEDISELLGAHYSTVPHQHQQLNVGAQYIDQIPQFIDWVAAQDSTSAFWFNVQGIVNFRHGVPFRSLSSLAAGVGMWFASKVQRDTQPTQSTFLGSVGEKLHVELSVVRKHVFSTQFGRKTMLVSRDGVGNSILLEANTTLFDEIDAGAKLTVSGTVKKHDVYKDIQQTVLNRCKLWK